MILVGVTLLASLAGRPEVAAQPAVKAGVVVEITGGGAPVGNMWKNGVQMAVDEINQAGGILGRRVETFVLDTQSDPPTSVAVMKRAVAEKPLVILGPIYSSSTKANMVIAQEAGIPQVTGSEAAELSRQDLRPLSPAPRATAPAGERAVGRPDPAPSDGPRFALGPPPRPLR
jgi:branched-chain amino acid transport system substrate-binding protein